MKRFSFTRDELIVLFEIWLEEYDDIDNEVEAKEYADIFIKNYKRMRGEQAPSDENDLSLN